VAQELSHAHHITISYKMADESRELCTTLKTYGPKPRSFKLEDGEEYMLGSEVGNYLRLFRGDLYKKYPSLYRRKMTSDERRLASEQIGYSHCNISSNVMMVKVSEIEELLSGAEAKYRTSAGFEGSYMPSSMERSTSSTQSHGGGVVSFTTQSGRNSKKNWISSIPNYSYHLDAVPSATPIGHHRLGSKKIKSFPTFYDDKNPAALYSAAAVPELIVPIRLDIDIEGQKLRDTFTWNKNG
jgi:SWI/SNF-related matrix-associated actin-dependent regulator of chromatin subfamily B protein 1